MDSKQIGALLARLRKERGMTRQVAEALHVSPQAVSKWERGVSHKPFHFCGLCKAITDDFSKKFPLTLMPAQWNNTQTFC